MKKKELIEYSIKKEHIYVLLGLIQFSILLSLLGASANIIAVYFNDGKMPVYSTLDLDDYAHFSTIDKAQIKFFVLSDKFKMKLGYIENYYSIGDVLIIIGIIFSFSLMFLLIIKSYQFKKLNKKFKIYINKNNVFSK